MNVGDLPPTQLYASLAFVLSVATLWFNRLKNDARASEYMRSHHTAIAAATCTILTLPILHVLYVLLVQSSANVWHQIAHALPLVGALLGITLWWIRTLAVTPTVEAEEEAPS